MIITSSFVQIRRFGLVEYFPKCSKHFIPHIRSRNTKVQFDRLRDLPLKGTLEEQLVSHHNCRR